MDYKQKYDELIERLRKAKYDDNVCDERFCCVIDEIAPELKESEDELTWLTKYIEEEAYSLSMDIRDNEDRVKLKNLKRSLAWLENIPYTIDHEKREGFRLGYKAGLEKQGEQKDNLSAQEAMDIAVAKCFDKDELKPSDKVEPKFKKG